MALKDLTRLYAQNNQQPWQQQLYGPQQILFNPDETNMADFGSGIDDEDKDKKDKEGKSDGTRYEAERAGMDERDPINQGGMPNITDPDYWAGQFKPDIGWKDTMKAYGPYMAKGLAGNPITAGFAMAKNYMNPTRDPVWQGAAQQYLSSIGSPTSLSDLTKNINRAYLADPLGAGVFASDTALGTMFGLPGSPMANTMSTGMGLGLEPYQLAQGARGAEMIGLDPTQAGDMGLGQNAVGSTMAGYGYSGPDYSNLSKTLNKNFIGIQNGQYSTDGPVAQAAQRAKESIDHRNRVNDWMEATLNKETEDDFDKWNNGGNDGGQNTNAGGYDGTNTGRGYDGGGIVGR